MHVSNYKQVSFLSPAHSFSIFHSKTKPNKSVIVEIHWMTCRPMDSSWSGDAASQTVSVGEKRLQSSAKPWRGNSLSHGSLFHSAASGMQQKRPLASYKFAPSGRVTRRRKLTLTTVLSASRATRPTTWFAFCPAGKADAHFQAWGCFTSSTASTPSSVFSNVSKQNRWQHVVTWV